MRALACLILTLALAGCGYSGGSSDNSNAALLLMGATAFSNGYTQARPAMAMCFNTGAVLMCQ